MTETATAQDASPADSRLVPNLWFAGNAEEAGEFYARTIPGARVAGIERYPTEGLLDFQQPMAGQALTVDVALPDLPITLINAGDEFRPNPSISVLLTFDPARDEDARASIDAVHAALSEGGTDLMPLDSYPFAPRYAWVQDRYGVSWQLMLTEPGGGAGRPRTVPALMFGGAAQNRCREAIDHYVATLPDSAWGTVHEYPEQTGPAPRGAIMFSEARLAGQPITAMDSGVEQPFSFTEGASLMIRADGQEELDRLWAALSRVPEAEQCGWCKDEYGLSWQIVPANLGELMSRPGAYEKLMSMTKIEIDEF
ncbi:VOC family protein [Brachybacterium huguangmaarense]